MALVSSPSLPAQSVKDLVALAKASPGRINYASAGNGSPGHLSGELLKGLAGVELAHIPYKGTGAALTDLMAGQVQLIFTCYPAVSSFVQNGRLKLLAVTGTKRDPALPTVPTVAEGGVPGYEVVCWLGFIAAAGVPRATVDRLNTEIAEDCGGIVYLHSVRGNTGTAFRRIMSGSRAPLEISAIGLAWLAGAPPELRREKLAGIAARYGREWAQIQTGIVAAEASFCEFGYCVSRWQPGSVAIARPLAPAHGQLFAVNLSYRKATSDARFLREQAARLTELAAALDAVSAARG